jgi:YD repeat-containing protein
VVTENVGSTAYDAPATGSHEAGTPVTYDLDAYISDLQAGDNVLAVQGHNRTINSSDFSLIPALRAEITVVPIQGLSATNDSPTALGLTTTLTATVTAGSNVTYTWAFGDDQTGQGAVVTASNPMGVVTATTTVTVTGDAYTTTTRVITYTYDKLYRLTDADYSSGERFGYEYDPVGNPVSAALRGTYRRTVHVHTQTLTTTTVTTYTYDNANRLDYFYEGGVQTDLTWDDNPLVTLRGRRPLRYTSEACGNLLTQGTNVYTWNTANRLIEANVDGVVSGFEYNGLGQRTETTVATTTTEYVLDVAGGLPEVIVASTGGASTRYVQIQGQVLAQYDSGTWAYLAPDALDSVRQLVDANGQVTLAQHYDPYGNLLEAAGVGGRGTPWEVEEFITVCKSHADVPRHR